MILTLSTFDIVLMMDPDMDPKRRLGLFDTVVSPTATSTKCKNVYKIYTSLILWIYVMSLVGNFGEMHKLRQIRA